MSRKSPGVSSTGNRSSGTKKAGKAPVVPVVEEPPRTDETPGAGHVVLWGLLAVSLVLSVLFALRVPLDANPDETAHLEYIREIIARRGFVQFVPDPTYRLAEAHQPPLYYLLCVPVYAAAHSLFAVRLVAAVAQLGTVAVTYFACWELFPRWRNSMAIGAAAFAAFLPTQAQLSGAVSNDGLTTLLCAVIFWRLGKLIFSTEAQASSLRDAAILGVLLGVGLLTKISVLQLFPVVLVAYALAARSQALSWGRAALSAGIALGLGLLIASPWLIRNQMLYGDPLALSIYAQTGPNYAPSQIMQAAGWSFADYARNVGLRSLATFWYFLSPRLPFTRFVGPPLPFLVILVLALGGLLGVYRWLKNSSNAGARRVALLFLAGVLLILPFYLRFVLTVFQAQGRYFLPALLPVAALTALGWATFGDGADARRRFILALLPGGVLLLMTLIQLARGGYLAG